MFDNEMLLPNGAPRPGVGYPRDVPLSGGTADRDGEIAADIVRDLISDTRRNLTHLADLRAAHIEAFRALEAMHAETLEELEGLLEFLPCRCGGCRR